MKVTLDLLQEKELLKMVKAYMEKYMPNAQVGDTYVNYIALFGNKSGVSSIEVEIKQ